MVHTSAVDVDKAEASLAVLLGRSPRDIIAAAIIEPGVLLARVEAKGNRRRQRPDRILAPVIIGRGMGRLDRALGHGIGEETTISIHALLEGATARPSGTPPSMPSR